MRLLVLLFSLLFPMISGSNVNSKTVYGYIQKATIVDQNITFSAKLDTGARSSSLHAVHIVKIKKNGKMFVQFDIPHENKLTTITREYFGSVKIKPRALEAEHISRPVIWMKIRLGEKEQLIRLNLTDRGNFTYPLLLGRQAIVAFNGIVDPSAKFTIDSESVSKLEKP